MTRILFSLFCIIFVNNSLWAQQCRNDISDNNSGTGSTVFQILGSGGPIADDPRASSSYLLWQGPHSRALIDIGGGSILRFAEAGANIDDLQAIGITHTHVDHIGDFPALVKSAFFSNRRNALPVFGPDSSDLFPGIYAYIRSTFTDQDAIHKYLAGIADGRNGQFAMPVTEIKHKAEAKTVFKNDTLEIQAVGVSHAIVPAVGYVITVTEENQQQKKIAIPGDTGFNIPAFIELASGADILVLHLAIPESVSGGITRLHAKPSEMGLIAQRVMPKQLVISHVMQRAERELDDVLIQIKKSYTGLIHVANDLDCIAL